MYIHMCLYHVAWIHIQTLYRYNTHVHTTFQLGNTYNSLGRTHTYIHHLSTYETHIHAYTILQDTHTRCMYMDLPYVEGMYMESSVCVCVFILCGECEHLMCSTGRTHTYIYLPSTQKTHVYKYTILQVGHTHNYNVQWYVYVPQCPANTPPPPPPPPFATLASLQNGGGACTWDVMISLAITPPLPVPIKHDPIVGGG